MDAQILLLSSCFWFPPASARVPDADRQVAAWGLLQVFPGNHCLRLHGSCCRAQVDTAREMLSPKLNVKLNVAAESDAHRDLGADAPQSWGSSEPGAPRGPWELHGRGHVLGDPLECVTSSGGLTEDLGQNSFC